jgi:hypothetical protein
MAMDLKGQAMMIKKNTLIFRDIPNDQRFRTLAANGKVGQIEYMKIEPIRDGRHRIQYNAVQSDNRSRFHNFGWNRRVTLT